MWKSSNEETSRQNRSLPRLENFKSMTEMWSLKVTVEPVSRLPPLSSATPCLRRRRRRLARRRPISAARRRRRRSALAARQPRWEKLGASPLSVHSALSIAWEREESGVRQGPGASRSHSAKGMWVTAAERQPRLPDSLAPARPLARLGGGGRARRPSPRSVRPSVRPPHPRGFSSS